MAKKKHAGRGFSAKASSDRPTVSGKLPQTPSWQLFIVNLRLLRRYGATIALLVVLPQLLALLGAAIAGNATVLTADRYVMVGIAIRLIAGILSAVGFVASYYYILRVVGGRPAGWLEACHLGGRYIWRIFLVTTTLAMVVGFGLLLLVVPGLIWLRRYFLAPYFAIDNDLGVRDALVASSLASKPARRDVWTTILLMGCVLGASYASARFLPVVGVPLAAVIPALAAFLPALRYQEITSDIRSGSLALRQAE